MHPNPASQGAKEDKTQPKEEWQWTCGPEFVGIVKQIIRGTNPGTVMSFDKVEKDLARKKGLAPSARR